MFKPAALLVIITPEGKKQKPRKVFRAYIGKHRITWINMDGTRGYVLLRHGFTYKITNQ